MVTLTTASLCIGFTAGFVTGAFVTAVVMVYTALRMLNTGDMHED